MTEEKKIYLQHSFRWGSIIGFVSFIYYLVCFYTKFEKNTMIFNNIYFFLSMGLLIAMFTVYRRQMGETKVKYGRYVLMGLVASVVTSFFTTLFLWVRMKFLDPFHFSQVLIIIQESMKDYKFIDTNTLASNPNFIPMMKVSYLFSNFIMSIVSNLLYILIIAWAMTMNTRFYNRNNQQK